jgi:hypothetical protein
MATYAVQLAIISPYVDARVDSNTFSLGNPMPDLTLTLCRSRLSLPVRPLALADTEFVPEPYSFRLPKTTFYFISSKALAARSIRIITLSIYV